jgi:cysteine desulfurase
VGLIAGFHAAAEQSLARQKETYSYVERLNRYFSELLTAKGLLKTQNQAGVVSWNSPEQCIPHIVSLSIPGLPAAPLAKYLEERRCLVSVGSACSARKPEPDPVLSAMGFSEDIQKSTIRVSLSEQIQTEDVETLVHALDESIQQMSRLLGKTRKR